MNSSEIHDLQDKIAQYLAKLKRLEERINKSEEDYKEQIIMKYATFSEIPPYYFLVIETIIHSCICTFGYLGNIITCIVIASDKSMRTTTNIYLFNLAVADLIMLSSGLTFYTIASWYPYRNYNPNNTQFGMKGCFFFNWVSDVAVNVSIMTLTAFTIERYLAICRPFLARMTLSISKAIKFIFLIWIIGFVFGYLVFSQRRLHFMEDESTPVCYFPDKTIEYITEIETLIFFVLPFILITVLYTLIWKKLVDSSKIQKKRGSSNIQSDRSETQSDDGTNKTIMKMLVTVVAVFFFVWAPYHCGRLVLINIEKLPVTFIDTFKHIDLFLESTYVIVYFLSSAINPVIYSIMSNKFRLAFLKVFKCWNICQRRELKKSKQNHSRKRSTAV